MSTQASWQTPEQIDNSPRIPDSLDGLGILIVDDQPDHLELMREILVGAGYADVFVAPDGKTALKALETHKQIGLVLTDLGLPGMDGYEVCRKIKSDPATQDVCVIVVTGGAIQIDAALCKSFESGAIDFISKPLNRFDLLARCQSALNLYNEKQQNLSQELELVFREEKYKATFDYSHDGIFILNPGDLLIRDVNSQAEALFGFESAALIGKPFTSLCRKNAIPEEYRNVSSMESGDVLTLETTKLSKTGDELSVEIKFSAFQLQGETRVMAVVADASSRVHLTENLQQSVERLNLAVSGKDHGIWDWDIAGGSIYFSDNWRRFLGLSKNDSSTGMEIWKKHLHPDEIDGILKVIRRHWNKETDEYSQEHRLLAKSGKYRWVQARGTAIRNEAGEVIRMAGTMLDVTRRKQIEIESVQKQRMEGLDRFAGSVAQDLNRMLVAVNAATRLIEDAVPHHTAVTQYVADIRRATEGSRGLIQQLLAFSRKSEMQLEYVFLNLEIKSLLPMVEGMISKSITLETDLEDELPPVLADHTMISQILLNLVLNSMDAMPDGGVLNIETSQFRLKESQIFAGRELEPGEYLKLTVGDDGVGMDDQTMEQIFEPFYSTKGGEEGQVGSGLGLSTVYGIMKQHNGWISVKSRPSVGTRFDLYFPMLNDSETES